jgi:hypothetical protein
MSAGSILTLGLGPSGSASKVLTLGYGIGTEPFVPPIAILVPRGARIPVEDAIDVRHVSVAIHGGGHVYAVVRKEREAMSPAEQAFVLISMSN